MISHTHSKLYGASPIQMECYEFLKQGKFSLDYLVRLGLLNEARLAEVILSESFSGNVNDNPNTEGYDFIVKNSNFYKGENEVKTKTIHQTSTGSYAATISNMRNKKNAHLHVWLQHLETKQLFKMSVPAAHMKDKIDGDTLTISMTKFIKPDNAPNRRDVWADDFIYEIIKDGEYLRKKMPVW